jgi:hypothetical protein
MEYADHTDVFDEGPCGGFKPRRVDEWAHNRAAQSTLLLEELKAQGLLNQSQLEDASLDIACMVTYVKQNPKECEFWEMGSPVFWAILMAQQHGLALTPAGYATENPSAWDVDTIHERLRVWAGKKERVYEGSEASLTTVGQPGLVAHATDGSKTRSLCVHSLGPVAERLKKARTVGKLLDRAVGVRHSLHSDVESLRLPRQLTFETSESTLGSAKRRATSVWAPNAKVAKYQGGLVRPAVVSTSSASASEFENQESESESDDDDGCEEINSGDDLEAALAAEMQTEEEHALHVEAARLEAEWQAGAAERDRIALETKQAADAEAAEKRRIEEEEAERKAEAQLVEEDAARAARRARGERDEPKYFKCIGRPPKPSAGIDAWISWRARDRRVRELWRTREKERVDQNTARAAAKKQAKLDKDAAKDARREARLEAKGVKIEERARIKAERHEERMRRRIARKEETIEQRTRKEERRAAVARRISERKEEKVVAALARNEAVAVVETPNLKKYATSAPLRITFSLPLKTTPNYLGIGIKLNGCFALKTTDRKRCATVQEGVISIHPRAYSLEAQRRAEYARKNPDPEVVERWARLFPAWYRCPTRR